MDTPQGTPGAIRLVGASGKFNTSRHHLGLCRCVILTGRYSTSDKDVIDLFNGNDTVFANRLRAALAAVVNRHPMLRVGIANEGSADPEFIALRTINLQQVIDWRNHTAPYDDKVLIKSLEKDHDQLWSHVDSQPPWKIIVNQPPASQQSAGSCFVDISFAFHHAIGDAESALIFHRDLVQALNDDASHSTLAMDKKDVLSIKSAADLPGPLEEVVPLKTSWIYVLCVLAFMMWSKIAPAWLKADPAKGPWGGKQITFEPFETRLSILNIPNSTLSSTLKKCREKGTTLTPLLHALVLRSLSSRLHDNEANSFRASTPISLRYLTNTGFDRRNTMHCLVTSHEFHYKQHMVSSLRAASQDDADASIWSAATSLGQSLRSKVSSLPKNDQMGLLGFVSDWQQFWANKLGAYRNDSWSCSNVGSLKAADSGAQAEGGTWVVDRLVFTQGALPAGPTFQVNVVGVENKGITITFSSQGGIVDEALIQAVASDIEASLAGFASSGN
ncbi:hypothetical protein NLG97_g5792 [Lecanicillium saksenae]|uniref:Uncharacterized protein n=1 Tax=Lecanicillium saksenae TaxID=468837 RepID=A0ACC1QUM6_9HYPO|nr:hypothetical protein NLG97_g5792 [Lecanicillium saksenae]